MNSKYFKVGALVEIRTEKSLLPQKNVKILETQGYGFVGQQDGVKDAPIKWFAWEKVEMELQREAAVTGTRTQAGKPSDGV